MKIEISAKTPAQMSKVNRTPAEHVAETTPGARVFSVRSNAVRAARKALGSEAKQVLDFNIDAVEGGFVWRLPTAAETESHKTPAKAAPVKTIKLPPAAATEPDTSDIPEQGREFFAKAKLVEPKAKKPTNAKRAEALAAARATSGTPDVRTPDGKMADLKTAPVAAVTTGGRVANRIAELKAGKDAGTTKIGTGAKALALLQREGGATVPELLESTGWQGHTLRGWLSQTVGGKMGLKVNRKRDNETKVTTYWVDPPKKGAAA